MSPACYRRTPERRRHMDGLRYLVMRNVHGWHYISPNAPIHGGMSCSWRTNNVESM